MYKKENEKERRKGGKNVEERSLAKSSVLISHFVLFCLNYVSIVTSVRMDGIKEDTKRKDE